MTQGQKNRSLKQKQYSNKVFNKDFLNGPIKKIFFCFKKKKKQWRMVEYGDNRKLIRPCSEAD